MIAQLIKRGFQNTFFFFHNSAFNSYMACCQIFESQRLLFVCYYKLHARSLIYVLLHVYHRTNSATEKLLLKVLMHCTTVGNLLSMTIKQVQITEHSFRCSLLAVQ